MTSYELMTYSAFTQKFIEVKDEMKGLLDELGELIELKQKLPRGLIDELNKCTEQYQIMVAHGDNAWSKTESQLYKDGWDFWMKEDAELREKRYGS